MDKGGSNFLRDIKADAKQFIEKWIHDNFETFTDVSKSIFENPELGMQEYRSAGLLKDLLRVNGFTVEEGVAGMPTAFLATYGTGKPVIGFSAEYDCLPGLSQKVTVQRAPVIEGGPGHGCGHHLLGVAAISAACALKNAIDAFGLKATIKVYGTPAEEACIGKPFMARAGIFNDADAILDWHPGAEISGVCTDSNAYFSTYYHFKGETCHGNAPWYGKSALDAAIVMGIALEFLREHIPPGKEGSENTYNYTFSDTGPEIPNVVPDRVTFWCIGRFADTEMMSEFQKKVDNCAKGVAMAMGVTVEKELVTAIHEKVPNMTMAKVLHDNITELGPISFTEEEQNFVMEIAKNNNQEPRPISDVIHPLTEFRCSVTDNSEYYWFAPTAMVEIALTPYASMHHHWTGTAIFGSSVGLKSIPYVGKLLSFTALDLISNPKLLEEAKKEFNMRMNGRSYKTLLGDTKPPLDMNKLIMEKYRKIDG